MEEQIREVFTKALGEGADVTVTAVDAGYGVQYGPPGVDGSMFTTVNGVSDASRMALLFAGKSLPAKGKASKEKE